MSDRPLICVDDIQKCIHTLRGVQVMFDEELAKLYGVETKRLNEQVKRNIERFPAEFMFQPSETELENLKSQLATSSWGGRRHPPYVFTEHLSHRRVAQKSRQKVVRLFEDADARGGDAAGDKPSTMYTLSDITLPIPPATDAQKASISARVDRILALTRRSFQTKPVARSATPTADIIPWEQKIDQIVEGLFGDLP